MTETNPWGDHQAAGIDYEPDVEDVVYAVVWLGDTEVGIVWGAADRPVGTLRAGVLQWTEETAQPITTLSMALLDGATDPGFDGAEAVGYWSDTMAAGKAWQIGPVRPAPSLSALRAEAQRRRGLAPPT